MGGCFHRVYINFLVLLLHQRWDVIAVFSGDAVVLLIVQIRIDCAGAAGVIGVRSVLIMSIACDDPVFNSQVRGFALDKDWHSMSRTGIPRQGLAFLDKGIPLT